MKSECKVPVSELAAQAREILSKALGCPAVFDEPEHHRFWNIYPNSAGPFTGRGGICMHAMWWYQMDAFVTSAERSETGESIEIAAVFAAGKFWSVVEWKMTVEMKPLE